MEHGSEEGLFYLSKHREVLGKKVLENVMGLMRENLPETNIVVILLTHLVREIVVSLVDFNELFVRFLVVSNLRMIFH
jgi:hypothetical protein